jgi:recombination protein RecA
MSKINKQNGSGTVILGSQITQPIRETITSGSLNLDAALGGGWATNHWVEIIGHESTGKTYLVLKTIAANQKLDPDWTTVWFATEDFSEQYAKMLGVDVGRVIIENENLMEVVYQHAIEFLDTKGIDCMVIDSLPFLVPAREDDGDMADFQPGLPAFLTGKFFRKSQGSIKRSLTEPERPCTGFVINGWREKIGTKYGDPRTTPGGRQKNFVFFQRVDVSRDEWITNSKGQPVGQTMKLQNIKNKYARPRLVGYVDAYVVNHGGHKAGEFDLAKDVVSAALAYDVITKPDKSHYEFNAEQWYGRPNLDAAVQEDRQLQRRIRKAVLTAAAAPLSAPSEAPRKKVTRAKTGTKRTTTSVTSTRKKSGQSVRRKTTQRVGLR